MADEPLTDSRMHVHTVITLASGGTITIDGVDMTPESVRELFALLASGGLAIGVTADG